MNKFGQLIQFRTLQDARDYRHANGTGGWIFEDEASGQATLFPPHLTPSCILRHPMTRHLSGRLVGSM